MAKYAQHTKVIIAGEDVSNYVETVVNRRIPGDAQWVELKILVDRLTVAEDGTLIFHIAEGLIA